MKPVTFLAVGDLHADNKLFNLEELREDQWDILDQLVAIAIERKATWFMGLGDYFNTAYPSSETIARLRMAMQELVAAGVGVAGIQGDHDYCPARSWINDVLGFEYILPEHGHGCLGKDYDLNPRRTVAALAEYAENSMLAGQVRFLMLHGQFREMYPFAEEKKTFDFSGLDLRQFPNLKAIVMGDLHHMPAMPDGSLWHGFVQGVPVVYTESPGIVKTDEIGRKVGALFWNGEAFERIPLSYPREYNKIICTGMDDQRIAEIVAWHQQTKWPVKPVIVLAYKPEDKALLPKFDALREIGLVRSQRIGGGPANAPVNARSEMKTGNRVSDVLREQCPDDSVYSLALEVLGNDPAAALDRATREFNQQLEKI